MSDLPVLDCKKMHSKCKAQCCGIVPIPKDIYDRNKNKMHREPLELHDIGECVVPITADNYCVFFDADLNCAIYEDRPDVCRKFGDESHPMLFCPYLDKDGKERSRQCRRQVERNCVKHTSKLKVI